MDNNQYLIVYGGYGGSLGGYNDIAFLNLNQRNLGWVHFPGIQLNAYKPIITGGIVKHLSASSCDMMYTTYYTGLMVCKGNYTWTKTTLNPAPASKYKRSVAVGANLFPTCV